MTIEQIIEQQELQARKRNIGFVRESVTVTSLDGIPWTVSGNLVPKIKYGHAK